MDYRTFSVANMTVLSHTISYLLVLLHGLNAGSFQLEWSSYPKPQVEFPFCHSCEGYCGLRRSHNCSCDHLCVLYEDCCHDFRLTCSQDNARALHLIDRFGGALPSCSVPHVEACWDTIIPPVLIASCPKNKTACRYIRHDIYSFLPVSDKDTGLNFINIKCAICNGIRKIKPWGLKISDVQKSNVHARDPMDDLLLLKPNKTLYFTRPLGQNVKRCNNVAPGWKLCTECHVTYRGHSINYTYTSCEFCLQEYRNLTKICNSSDKRILELLRKCMNCRSIYNSTVGCISPRMTISQMSLSILFDFTDSGELSVHLKLNRLYACPPGYIRKNVEICARSENIPAVDLNGLLDIHKREYNETCSSYELIKICLQRLKETIREQISLQHHVDVEIYFNDTSRVVAVEVTVTSETYRDIKHTEDAAVIKDGVTHEVQLLFTKNPLLIKRVNVTLAVYVKLKSQPGRRLYVLCRFISYQTNVTMKSLAGSTANADELNANVTCLDYLVESDNRHFDRILTIVQIVLQSMSLVALGIRIGMCMIIKEFKDPSGRVLTAYMTAMLFSHLLHLLSSLAEPDRIACYIMGVCLHWFYLMMFAWMSVLAVDIARMILSSSRLHKLDVNYKDFAYYCVAAIGLPTLIVTISFILDQTNMREDLKPNYGRKHCWISGTYPLLIFFAVPVAGVLLLNGVCFTVAIVLLCRTAYTCSRSVDHRANALLYMKLFVLMGLTWGLGFVSGFTGSLVVRFLYTILNASQGFLVAMAVICSSHSRTILREKFSERTKSGSTKCQGSKRSSSIS